MEVIDDEEQVSLTDCCSAKPEEEEKDSNVPNYTFTIQKYNSDKNVKDC